MTYTNRRRVKTHQVKVLFNDDEIELVLEAARQSGKPAARFCREKIFEVMRDLQSREAALKKFFPFFEDELQVNEVKRGQSDTGV